MNIKNSHLKYLSKIDKVQKRLIEKYDKPLVSKSEDYILDVCRYIIFQQISTKAGISIYKRFTDFYIFNKNKLISWNQEDCKNIGLSKQKKNYIENIFKEKNSINDLYDCTDQSIIRNKLIKIKGIGNWTIDMFMIFTKEDLTEKLILFILASCTDVGCMTFAPKEAISSISSYDIFSIFLALW